MPYFEMRLLAAPEVLKSGIKRLFIGKEPFQKGLSVSRLLMAKGKHTPNGQPNSCLQSIRAAESSSIDSGGPRVSY